MIAARPLPQLDRQALCLPLDYFFGALRTRFSRLFRSRNICCLALQHAHDTSFNAHAFFQQDHKGGGIVHFRTRDDMEYALRKLDGSDFRNPFEKSRISVSSRLIHLA